MRKVFILLLLPMVMLAEDRYRIEYIVFKWQDMGKIDRFQSLMIHPTAPLFLHSPAPLLTLRPLQHKLAQDPHLETILYGSQEVHFTDKSPRTIYLEPQNDLTYGAIQLRNNQYLEAKLDIHLGPQRMQEMRRMRRHQLHYFDHPAMGLLLIAEPLTTLHSE
jgi:hypothetical protein